MDASGVMLFARENDAKFVDVRFLDLVGGWQHFTIPVRRLEESLFTTGRLLEGPVLRGYAQAASSQMRVVADPATMQLDPFAKTRTLALIASLHDSLTGAPLFRDPREVARRATRFLGASSVADGVEISQEVEFYLFEDVRYDQTRNSSYFYVDSDEGRVNQGREEPQIHGLRQSLSEPFNLAPCPDSFADMRSDMVEELTRMGLPVNMERHDGSSAGHGSIELGPAGLVAQADNLLWIKYVAKNAARHFCKVATFMPRPLAEEQGNGLTIGLALTKDGKNVFAGGEGGALSQEALWFIGGLLKHHASLSAFVNPTLNSYRRLAPGGEGPVNIAYSSANRQVAVGIPQAGTKEEPVVRFRLPDSSANPYLAFAAVVMAGLDGIEKKLDPGAPLDRDVSQLTQEELNSVPVAASGLEEALAALEEDSEYLLKGEVFTPDLLTAWIELKMDGEVAAARGRPTPLEYSLYFDC